MKRRHLFLLSLSLVLVLILAGFVYAADTNVDGDLTDTDDSTVVDDGTDTIDDTDGTTTDDNTETDDGTDTGTETDGTADDGTDTIDDTDGTTTGDNTETDDGTDTEEPVIENVEDYLNQLEGLEPADRIALERTLTSYEGKISLDIIERVVDSHYSDEGVEVGQVLVTLKNFESSVDSGISSERINQLLENAQAEDDTGKVMFQAALELRKIARVNAGEEGVDGFIQEMVSNMEGEETLEISELKQMANKYRKELREKARNKEHNRKDATVETGDEEVEAAVIGVAKKKQEKAKAKAKKKANKGKSKGKSKGKGKHGH